MLQTYRKIISLGAMTWSCYIEKCIMVIHVIMRQPCVMQFIHETIHKTKKPMSSKNMSEQQKCKPAIVWQSRASSKLMTSLNLALIHSKVKLF